MAHLFYTWLVGKVCGITYPFVRIVMLNFFGTIALCDVTSFSVCILKLVFSVRLVMQSAYLCML